MIINWTKYNFQPPVTLGDDFYALCRRDPTAAKSIAQSGLRRDFRSHVTDHLPLLAIGFVCIVLFAVFETQWWTVLLLMVGIGLPFSFMLSTISFADYAIARRRHMRDVIDAAAHSPSYNEFLVSAKARGLLRISADAART